MTEIVDLGEEESRLNSLLSKRRLRYGLIWGCWSIAALFFSTQAYMMYYADKQPIPYLKAFFVQASACYLWALATPLVLWLSRRFRIGRSNWPRTVAFHLVASVSLILVLLTVHFVIYLLLVGRATQISAIRIFEYLYPNLDRWLLIYWTILLMSHAYNYYHSCRQSELKASQLRTQLVQSQLEALKMQVQPHFLFNTLHAISSLLSQDTECARKMITRLGDFLRLTLENSGAMEVTLRQEMEFLNGYLEIERIRFQDRLSTEITVDPQLLDTRVPNLILQPIVENAMRHAIANSGQGRVEITAAAKNGSLKIQVKDNGPGICSKQSASPNAGLGVGLTNTKARLERLYGADHKFELENGALGGLTVTMEIPRNV